MGELIECHGPTVDGLKVGFWTGSDENQAVSNGISFTGTYNSNQPYGHWVIKHNRYRDGRTIPSTVDMTFKAGNLPEQLNSQYRSR